jgi:hypothetical protein
MPFSRQKLSVEASFRDGGRRLCGPQHRAFGDEVVLHVDDDHDSLGRINGVALIWHVHVSWACWQDRERMPRDYCIGNAIGETQYRRQVELVDRALGALAFASSTIADRG